MNKINDKLECKATAKNSKSKLNLIIGNLYTISDIRYNEDNIACYDLINECKTIFSCSENELNVWFYSESETRKRKLSKIDLTQYYDIILDKLQKGDYRIGVNKKFTPPDKSDIKTNELPLHALNYMIFEYMRDHKDARWTLLFEYVVVPRGVNKGECDIDFTKVKFDDFVEFMVKVKT